MQEAVCLAATNELAWRSDGPAPDSGYSLKLMANGDRKGEHDS
jgi:hypothetical protein